MGHNKLKDSIKRQISSKRVHENHQLLRLSADGALDIKGFVQKGVDLLNHFNAHRIASNSYA